MRKRFSNMALIIDKSEQNFAISKQKTLGTTNEDGLFSTKDLTSRFTRTSTGRQVAKTARTTPNQRERKTSRINRLDKLIENCKHFEAESGKCEGSIKQKKSQIETIFRKTEEKSRALSASNDVTGGMRKMKSYDCFWELRRKKLTRMMFKDNGFKEDFMKVIERDEYMKYKQKRDKHGVFVYKMMKEKAKRENIKNSITNNAFRSYADKFLENKVGIK